MRQLEGKTAVVTGADSGIGLGLARTFAQNDMAVVVCAFRGAFLADALADVHALGLLFTEVLTDWLDPAVLSEQDPVGTDPHLDMYDPQHGPPYTAEFLERYRAAQRARNQRISHWCHSELDRLAGAGYPDRLLAVARTWADPRFVDPHLDPSDRPTPACYRGDPRRANRGIDGIGMVSSLRTWLAMWSLEDTQCHSAEALGLIDLPALVIQARSDTGVFGSQARSILAALGTEDKRLVELPGDHYFRGPGRPREDVADVIDEWVAQRAGAPR